MIATIRFINSELFLIFPTERSTLFSQIPLSVLLIGNVQFSFYYVCPSFWITIASRLGLVTPESTQVAMLLVVTYVPGCPAAWLYGWRSQCRLAFCVASTQVYIPTPLSCSIRLVMKPTFQAQDTYIRYQFYILLCVTTLFRKKKVLILSPSLREYQNCHRCKITITSDLPYLFLFFSVFSLYCARSHIFIIVLCEIQICLYIATFF